MKKRIITESVGPIKGDKVIVVFNSDNGRTVINLPLLTAEFPFKDSVGVWKIKNNFKLRL